MTRPPLPPLPELIPSQWEEWLGTLLPETATMARRYPPDHYYRLRSTGQIVTIYSYSDNGTMTVDIRQNANPDMWLLMERRVFGIEPEDLDMLDQEPR